MKYCQNSKIREEVLKIFGSKCNGGEFDNSQILPKQVAWFINKKKDHKTKPIIYINKKSKNQEKI